MVYSLSALVCVSTKQPSLLISTNIFSALGYINNFIREDQAEINFSVDIGEAFSF